MGRRTPPVRRAAARNRWLAASSMAMATAMLLPAPVAAQTTTVQGQAVKAKATFNTSDATYTSGSTTDVIRVQTNDLLINWVPDDAAVGGGAISFLPAGKSLFYNFDGTAYTVVNRILPNDQTRAIRFDGQVASFIGNFSSLGGNIYFYSPGGIIVGSTGRFDVGSLVLSTSDITHSGTGTTTLSFAQATQPNSKVVIEPWGVTAAGDLTSQIQTYGGSGSYMVLMAPTVEMYGRVNAQGHVGYIGAEAATMTISGTLFDIVINEGTTSATGVVHGADAITTGQSAGLPQRTIQMVAVPKNDALTMLVAGSVGYAAASSAGVVNGRIVLTAGETGGTDANLTIDGVTFGNRVTASASKDLTIQSTSETDTISVSDGTNALNFTGTAGGDIALQLTGGGSMSVGGNLSLTAGTGGTGGAIDVDIAGTTGFNVGLSVGQALTLDASATGSNDFSTSSSVGGDAVGGTVDVDVIDGRSISVGDTFTIDTSAQAGFGFAQAGDATGGAVNLAMSGDTGDLTVGSLVIDSRALAAVNTSGAGATTPAVGGSALGGDIDVTFGGGDSSMGTFRALSDATATGGTDTSLPQDNAAEAGHIFVSYTGGTHNIDAIDFSAVGTAGFSSAGEGVSIDGTVNRARIVLNLDAATLNLSDFFYDFDASTTGDVSASSTDNAIEINAQNSASLDGSDFTFTATHNNRQSLNPGTGGSVSLYANNSLLDFGNTTINTSTTVSGGTLTTASDKTAGSVSILAQSGGTIAANNLTIDATVLEGTGISGPASNTGGAVTLRTLGGALDFTGTTTIDTFVDVSRGGDQSGDVSTGGAVTISGRGAASDISVGTLRVDTRAVGTNTTAFYIGDGGNGAGGDITIDVIDGNFTAGGVSLNATATGEGGGFAIDTFGDGAGQGGSATGGDISVSMSGADWSSTSISLATSATGGNGGTGYSEYGASGAGAGGSGTAGNISLTASAGNFNADGTLSTNAVGTGGNGGFGSGVYGGAGGAGNGGDVTVAFTGAAVDISNNTYILNGNGIGGAGGATGFSASSGIPGGPGGTGGDATGGMLTFTASAGTAPVSGLTLNATGTAGSGGTASSGFSGGPASDGGAGGNATGGTAVASFGIDQSITPGSITLNASAVGGNGAYGANGGDGGYGTGGTAQLNVDNAAVGVYQTNIISDGTGGSGGFSGRIGGTGGSGGAGTGGMSGIDVFGLAGSFTADFDIDISSTGTGGTGRAGYGYFGSADGGDGGDGGNGYGGAIDLTARYGGTLNFTTSNSVDARGLGGGGGDGGYSYDGTGGTGGDGGKGYGGSIALEATDGGSLIVNPGGTADLLASGTGGLAGNRGSAGIGTLGQIGANGAQYGGSVDLLAAGAGSLLQISGNLDADASAVGRRDTRAGSIGSDATGGAVNLDIADGGAFNVTGTATLDATALATLGRGTIGNAFGGTVDATMSGAASTLDVGGNLVLDASAFEPVSTSTSFPFTPGGDTTGGSATVDFSGGTTTVVNDLLIDASAGADTPRGDPVISVFLSEPGNAIGGTVDLSFTGGSHTFRQSTVDIAARAPGAQATSGSFDLLVDNAQLAFSGFGSPGNLQVNHTTDGTTTAVGRDPSVDIVARNGALVSGNLSISGTAQSVDGSGTIRSGAISVLIDNATVSGSVGILSDAILFIGSGGGAAISGDIDVTLQNGATVSGAVGLNSSASGNAFGPGANALAGAITMTVADSSVDNIQFQSLAIARGSRSVANPNGEARTGDVTITVSGASSISNGLDGFAIAQADNSIFGNGFDATTGTFQLNLLGGTFAGPIDYSSFVIAGAGSFGNPGGDATTGAANILVDGATVQITGGLSLTSVLFSGAGGRGADTGIVRAGDLSLTVLSGSLTADSTALIANALQTTVFTSAGPTDAGNGGNAYGGDVSIINNGSGSVSLGSTTIGTSARGSDGGFVDGAGTGGDGGDGFAGGVTIQNLGTGSLDTGSLGITSRGTGGNGGYSTYGAGGNGGRGFGGTVAIGSTAALGVTDLTVVTDATGGTGGAGGSGIVGGNAGSGGAASAGDITFSTGSTPNGLTGLSLFARGYGGTGGANPRSFFTDYGGTGGTGGAGTGGSITVELTGTGTQLSSTTVNGLTANARGIGGTGGEGQYGYYSPGTGGAGGTGTGGTLTFASRSGATLDLAVGDRTLQASGVGGAGGAGGIGGDGSGAAGGTGGAGGTGLGGAINLIGQGGTVTAGDINLTATGTGGVGGYGGYSYAGYYGAGGANGGGSGGLVTIQALEGSPGIITLGAVSIDASGFAGGGDITVPTVGGSIEITDASTDPAGLITMGSLTAIALGSLKPADASFTMSGNSGPITVNNDMLVNVVGDIVFDFDGTGQLKVGGDTTLIAGGDILLTHTNNTTPVESIATGGDFTATAGGNFNAGAGSIANGSGNVSITALDIVYDEIDALGSVTLSASGGNIGFSGTGNIDAGGFVNATATGDASVGDVTSNGEVFISAQNIAFRSISAGPDNIFDAGEFSLTLNATAGDITGTSTGNLTAVSGVDLDATGAISIGDVGVNDGPITIDAGTSLTTGDVSIATGGLVSNESIVLNAGGDTVLGAVSAIDSLTVTSGGALTAASLRGTGITATAAGAVDIGDATIFDGVGGGGGITISGTSIILDSADASSTVGNDIQLDASAGGLTLGTINSEANLTGNATGDITFDNLTGLGIFLTTTGGSITGGFAAADRAINSGTPRQVNLQAAGAVDVTALESVDSIVIDAASLDAGSLTSGTSGTGNIIATLSGAATIGTIDANGTTDITASTIDLTSGSFSNEATLTSTVGDITFGTFDATRSVIFDSAANIVGTGSTFSGNRTIFNENQTFNAVGAVTLTGTINAKDAIVIDAGGQVTASTLNALGAVNVNAVGPIDLAATISGGATTITSGSTIALDSFTSGGTTTLAGTSITLIDGSSAGVLDIDATAGNIVQTGTVTVGDTANLDATGTISLSDFSTTNRGINIGTTTVGGDVTLGNVSSAGQATVISNGLIIATSLTTGGNATLNSNAIDIVSGNIGGAIDFDATTFVDLGNLTGSAAYTVDAGTDILFGTISTTNGNLTLTAGGNISGIDALNLAPVGSGGLDRVVMNAGGDITVTGTVQSVDDGVFLTSGGATTVGIIDAADTISATAGGALTVGTANNAVAAFDVTLQGASVTLDSGSIAGGLTLNATAGDVAGTGVIGVGGAIDLDATGNIGFGSLSAGGLFTADAGGNITFTAASSDNTMTFNAGGSILGGDVTTDQAAADSNFTAANAVTLGDVTTRILTVNAGTDITLGNVNALGRDIRGIAATLNAGGTVSFTSLVAGRGVDIDATVVNGGDLTADDGVDVLAQSITLGDVAILQNGLLTLNATAGTLTTGDLSNTNFAISATSAGDMSLGNITATSSDIVIDAGGDATIGDASAGDNLTIDVTGNLVSGALSANNLSPGTPITVGGDAAIASLDAAGPANLDIGGALTGGVFSADGGLTLTAGSIDIVGANSLNQSVNATATTGSALIDSASANVNVTVTAATLASVGTVSSGQATTITGQSVTLDSGIIGTNLTLNATAGDVSGTGAIDVGGGIDIDATGNVGFGTLAAGNNFTVDAGGNIAFTGASTTQGVVAMNAGGSITGGDVSSVDVAAINDNITFVAGGDLVLGTVQSGQGLSLTGATVATGDLTGRNGAVVVNTSGAANLGFLRGTGGIAVTAGSVRITGADAGLSLLNLSATTGDLVATGNMTTGGQADIDATGALSIQGLTAGAQINLDSGGAMSFTDVSTTNGQIGIDSGAGITGDSLTTVANAGVTDQITVNSVGIANVGTIDAGDNISVSGGGLVSNLLTAQGISVDVTGAAVIGTANSANDTFIQSGSVQLDNGSIGGFLVLRATAGDVNGAGAIGVGGDIDLDATGDINFGTLETTGGLFTVDAGGAINFNSALSASDLRMTAGGAINGGDLFATAGTLTLDGGSIAIGDASANQIDFTSASDILFNSLTSPNAITLIARSGRIGANTGPGDIDSDGDVTLLAQAIAVNDITSGGSVGATATTGDASFGTIDSAGNITISAAGTPTVLNAISAGDTSITGSSILFNNGTVGGMLTLNATAGDIDGRGTVTVGGAIDFDATGDVTFGSLDAGGAFTVDAGGAITFVRASSPTSLAFNAGGAINGGDIDVAGNASLSASTVAIGDAFVDGLAIDSGTDILFNSLTVRGPLSLTATSGVIGANTGPGDITADGDVTLLAQTIALGDVTSGGSLDATATLGDLLLDRVIVAGDITLAAGNGFIGVDHAEAGGDFTANSLTGFATGPNSIITGGDIFVATSGTADMGNSSAGGSIEVLATHIDFISLAAGTTIDLLTRPPLRGGGGDGDILGTDITAGAGASTIDAFGSIVVDGTLDIAGSLDTTSAGSTTLGTTNVGAAFTALAGTDFAVTQLRAGAGISVTNGGNADAGDTLATDGPVTFDVGGNLTGTSISNSATVLDPGDDSVTLTVAGTVDLTGNSTAGNDYTIDAGGDAALGSVTALYNVSVTTPGSVTAGTLDAGSGGGAVSSLTVDAGGTVDVAFVRHATTGAASLTGTSVALADSFVLGTLRLNATAGDITSTGNLRVNRLFDYDATGDILINTGQTFSGGTLDAGGDIRFASFTNGVGNLILNAGGNVVGGSLISNGGVGTSASRLFVTAGGDILLTGLTSGRDRISLSGTNVSADQVITLGDATVDGTAQVTLERVEGATVTITGAGVATNSIRAVNALTITATAGDVTGTGLYEMISPTGLATLDAAGAIDIGSVFARGGMTLSAGTDVLFSELVSDAGSVTVDAGGNILGSTVGATGAADAAGDDSVRLTAGGNVVLDGATTVLNPFNRAQDDFIVDAGGDVSIFRVQAGNDFIVTAGGTPTVGRVDSGGDTSITGATARLADADVGGNLTLNATAGDVDATGTITVGGAIDLDATGNVDFGTLSADGGAFTVDAGNAITFSSATSANDLRMTAGGAINGGDLDAAGTLTLDGGSIAIGAATANRIDFTSASDILFNSLTSPNAITLIARSGTIGANTGPGDIDSDGDVTLLAQSIAVNDITSGGSVGATATIGDASFGTIDSAGNITISAAGTPTVLNAISAGDTSITGSSILFNNGTVGGMLTLNATAGDIDGRGAVTVGGAIDFDATGDVTFGSLDAGGAFTVDAGGAITFVRASSPTSLAFNAGGAIAGGDIDVAGNASLSGSTVTLGNVFVDGLSIDSGSDILFDALTVRGPLSLTAASGVIGANTGPGDINADGDVTLLAQAIALGDITSGGSLNATATIGDASFGTIDAAADITVEAAGTPTIANAISGGSTSISGTSIIFSNGTVGGNLALDATAGDIDATGTIAVGGAIDFDAVQDVAFGTLAARGGSFTVDAGGDIAFANTTSTDFIDFNAGGAILGGDLSATNALSLDAARIAIGSASAGSLSLTSRGDILFSLLSSPNAIVLSAPGGIIGANGGAGDIESGGDVTLLARSIDLGDAVAGGSFDAMATAGNADFASIDADGNVRVSAIGTPTIGRVRSGGDTTIIGSAVNFANGDIGGDLALTATAGDIDANGAIAVGGAITLDATGDVGFGALDAQGGSFAVTAGSSIDFAEAAAAGAIDFAAGNTLTGGSAIATDELALRAGSTLTIGDAIGGSVRLLSAGGAVVVTNDIAATFAGDAAQVIVSGTSVNITDVNDLLLTLVQATDGNVSATATGDIGVVNAESVGDISLTSRAGDVRVTFAGAGKGSIVSVAGPRPAGSPSGNPGRGDILISAAGLAQGQFSATGNLAIDAGQAIDLIGAEIGQSIDLASGGNTRVFGAVVAGDEIAISGTGDVRVASSSASLEAGGDLTVSAGGTFDTQGFAYGTAISITAGDVVIGGTGQVGDETRTQSVTFTGFGTVNIGGEAVASSFSLDAEELGRIRNNGDLTFRALGTGNNADGRRGTAAVDTSGPARLVIREAAVAAGEGGQMGANSTLLFDSQGSTDVLGDLTVEGAGDDATLRLRSSGPTWLDTAGGNLRVEGADGTATGTVAIRSGSFLATSAEAREDIDGMSAADIDARLAQNDGVVRDEGFIQAGTLDVVVNEGFFVQNSGDGDSSDLDTRRGFAIDALSIGSGVEGSPLIVINGTVGGETGVEALAATDIRTAFDDASTINGCLIVNPAGCAPVPETPEFSFFDPSRDVIEEEIDPGFDAESLEGDLDSQLIDLSPPEDFQDDPLIDDPVTGAGNEDFWIGEPNCDPGNEDEAVCPTSTEAQPEAEQDEEELEPAE